MQLDWYISGTGSGGMVNIARKVNLVDGLLENGVKLDTVLLDTYKKWTEEHPFDKGEGWAKEPWNQEEMALDEAIVKDSATRSAIAIYVIGRTSGEDKDNGPAPGSYFLTETEENNIKLLTSAFKRVAVVLNVGNIIDMRWVREYNPSAVLYAWHGGQEGGGAAADVLCGTRNPSGGLPDTIAEDINDYPSTKNFGAEYEPPKEGDPPFSMKPDRDIYAEDIYVGYRYFETAAKDKVLYPFGYGLSYTDFEVEELDHEIGSDCLVKVRVSNVGASTGKARVLLFVSAPNGLLGKPEKVLCAFSKTDELLPGGSQVITLRFSAHSFSSYDDSGVTGHKSAYVLEAGDYDIYIGQDVRSAELIGGFTVEELTCMGHSHEALAPVTPFKRLHNTDNGLIEEDAPLATRDLSKRILEHLAEEPNFAYTGDKGIKLRDVYLGTADIDDFICQIPNDVLAPIVRGEGMNSPKVTPGTGGAIGGLTEELKAFGIPPMCCTDGPSGLRFDAGTVMPDGTVHGPGIGFSMPNGTCLASTFNDALNEKLFEYLGREMRSKNVDLILGPGVNIHRNPLNGRNFEYFSEDPLLTGKMAAAQLRGLHKAKVSGTLKHFACNNREAHRFALDSIASERALREIYLEGYRIAVTEGDCISIMSTYGMINGRFTAGNFDLCTTILRDEWGFDGLVMTDWGGMAEMPDFSTFSFGPPPESSGDLPAPPPQMPKSPRAAMVRAQNDLAMVTQDAKAENDRDDILEALAEGRLTRSELHRNARNILSVILRTPAIDRQ